MLSCTRDTAPEISCDGAASYESNIKAIIDTNCAYAGCHDGSLSAPGIFLDYEGLKSDIADGSFESEVVTSRTMPPDYALGPKTLTQEELDLIICWIEEDYPEN